jgi:NTP pyrophosphatase (non-canonical NTP hydrolase)|nr:MAG TPA: NTP-PPase-like protein [Caudoviricetes sp.]
MTPNEYQEAALRTANKNLSQMEQLQNGVMGLTGESGECADLLKKHLFQGHEFDTAHFAKELGDVAWYLAVSADALGYSLETIFRMNINKLKARYPDGFDADLSVHRKTGDI